MSANWSGASERAVGVALLRVGVGVVLDLVVPGLDGVGPAVFIAGGGKVLTTVTGCRWRKTGI